MTPVQEHRYTWGGAEIRVIVAGDVLAIPSHRWSMGYFGPSISIEWLEHEGQLPGSPELRRALASCLVRSLAAARGAVAYDGGADDPEIRGPLVRCSSCGGSGWARTAVVGRDVEPIGGDCDG